MRQQAPARVRLASSGVEEGGRERLGYRPELNGLRGVAIAVVVAVHTFDWLFPGGALGVDVFFVLSGFLITTLLIEEWDRHGSIALRNFWARRALRLLPALAVFLVAGVVVGVAQGASPGRVLATAGLTAGYVINIARAAGFDEAGPFGHTWSLAIEEQFYLVWPLAFVALMRSRVTRTAVMVIVAVPIVLLPLWRTLLVDGGATYDRVKLAPDTRADVLLVGCLLALALASPLRARLIGSPVVRALTVPAVAFLAAWTALGDGPGSLRALALWAYTAIALSAAVLILAALDDRPGLLRQALTWGPLVHLGRISYGLYLWHLVTIAAARWALPTDNGVAVAILGVGSALVVTEASWRLLEQPALSRKGRFPADGGGAHQVPQSGVRK